jgi:hypothetical protein
MELDELHVDERRPGAQRQGVTVAGVLPRVGRHFERLADATCREHHRGGLEEDEVAGLAPIPEGAGDLARPFPRRFARPLVQHEFGDRTLVEDPDPGLVVAEFLLVLLLQRHDLLLQRADDLKAGAVSHVSKPRVGVTAEVALADLAVLGAVEQCAVGLQLPDPVRGLLRVKFGHPPVVQELAAAHGVTEVHLPRVLRVDVAHRRGATAFGHHRVGLAEQRLGHHRDSQAAFAGLDHRA